MTRSELIMILARLCEEEDQEIILEYEGGFACGELLEVKKKGNRIHLITD